MTDQEIFNTIVNIIKDNFPKLGNNPLVELDTNLKKDLELDSVDKVEIKLALDAELNIKVNNDEFAQNCETPKHIVKVIARYVK